MTDEYQFPMHIQKGADEPREHEDSADCWCGPITEIRPALPGAPNLSRLFDYHAPNDDTKDLHAQLRFNVKEFAAEILAILPEGREAALFLTNLEQASFWAHAAIARSQS